jgi:magnesium chelatase family protein
MLARIKSQVVIGLDAHYVDVEVDIAGGLPNFCIVGLPDVSVKESRDRVKAAIKNCGFSFPARRVVVNLAPADIKKDGPSFDLPIAVAVLVANGNLTQEEVGGKSFCGELSLAGEIRPVRGVLAMAAALSKNGAKELVVPFENAMEAAVVRDIKVYAVKTLTQLYQFLKGEIKVGKSSAKSNNLAAGNECCLDFSDVRGQAHVKRGLEIAASGGHNVLMIGPPGSGKTMLARRMPTIMPGMQFNEALETTKIYSIAGLVKTSQALLNMRPFRSPHHTISYAGLVGGGSNPRPGEISLAHNGVLFLDELPEFRRDVLEALRQPLEEGVIRITRAEGSSSYPAKFIFIAAMNPCPCGFFTDPKRQCSCTAHQIQRYIAKVSGPLLDRIDIHLQAPALKYDELSRNHASAETSSQIKERVLAARQIQKKRYEKETVECNAYLSPKEIEKYCRLDNEADNLLKAAVLNMGLTARAYHKILKVSRTIADMAGREDIRPEHISEALQYRGMDRLELSQR